MTEQNKTLIVSFDAFGQEDVKKYIKEMPNLQRLVKGGTLIKSVAEIYPSLTYPSHTTIVTGDYPMSHKIVDNTLLQEKRFLHPDWNWWSRYIKTTTLYQIANKSGMSVASFLWPVTAGSKEIKYNLAEIFPNRIWENQYVKSFSSSSPLFLIQLQKRFGKLRDGIQQPQLDEFITRSAEWTIKEKKPDMLLIHLVDLDSMRHKFGVNSKEAHEAILRLDKHLGILINAYGQESNNLNILVTGDHYQIDVDQMIHLNKLFFQNGWIDYNDEKQVINSWQVLAKTTDGSTYIYIKNKKLILGVKKLIQQYIGKSIEKIFDNGEIVALGADDKADLMIEAKSGFYFTDEIKVSDLIEKIDDTKIGQPHRYKAVHGYHPKKNKYHTVSVFYGPKINKGKVISSANLIDLAPTMAKILDLKFNRPTDGKIISGVIDEK
ncbi:MAG: alkaline phosphatase family protein [Lactobacillaceae bacterium]|jgi:predicted AlkP superfamily pyrophosphatase or phosphodiesterase|nr:alkaline phosphatase family protein [Lactobacillaceae bacterium]